jgi:hypothetical protein
VDRLGTAAADPLVRLLFSLDLSTACTFIYVILAYEKP